jgi:hypothetical protein
VICAYLDYADDYIRNAEYDERVNYLDVMNALEASTGPLHTLGVNFRPFTAESALALMPFFTTQSFELSRVRTLNLHWPKSKDYIMDVGFLRFYLFHSCR